MRSDLIDQIKAFKERLIDSKATYSEGKTLWERLDYYIEEKVSCSNDLIFLSRKRNDEAKEAILFRDDIAVALVELKGLNHEHASHAKN